MKPSRTIESWNYEIEVIKLPVLSKDLRELRRVIMQGLEEFNTAGGSISVLRMFPTCKIEFRRSPHGPATIEGALKMATYKLKFEFEISVWAQEVKETELGTFPDTVTPASAKEYAKAIHAGSLNTKWRKSAR